MKNTLEALIWIFAFITAMIFIVAVSDESQVKMKLEHEFVMEKLKLESRYHVDSLQEVKWRNEYYQLLKQYYDAEK